MFRSSFVNSCIKLCTNSWRRISFKPKSIVEVGNSKNKNNVLAVMRSIKKKNLESKTNYPTDTRKQDSGLKLRHNNISKSNVTNFKSKEKNLNLVIQSKSITRTEEIQKPFKRKNRHDYFMNENEILDDILKPKREFQDYYLKRYNKTTEAEEEKQNISKNVAVRKTEKLNMKPTKIVSKPSTINVKAKHLEHQKHKHTAISPQIYARTSMLVKKTDLPLEPCRRMSLYDRNKKSKSPKEIVPEHKPPKRTEEGMIRKMINFFK